MMLSKTRLALFLVLLLLILWQPVLGQAVPQGGSPACTSDDDCDDGLFCNGVESCVDGGCVALSPCPPAINGCIQVGAICDEENDTCLDVPDDSLCDNGLFCDGVETCNPETGQCQPGLTCPAAIFGCKVYGACDEELDECIAELDDELCDSGEFCNENGHCQAEGTDCAENDDCDDGLFCNGVESCVDGNCVALSPCPPAINGCIQVGAICDEENDTCLDLPDDSLCDNGLFCDGVEFCDPETGECQPGLTCPAAIDGCKVYGACDEDLDECTAELDDGLCNAGEFCAENGQCLSVENFLPPDLLFGQVAIGSQGDLEIQSVITVTNSGSMTYEGVFFFFTGNGVVWNPIVNGDETTNGQHAISVPPFETFSMTLTGEGIEAGSAILRGSGPPETAIEGNLTYFFRTAGELTDSIGVGPSIEVLRSTIPFQDFSAIALALANPDAATKNIMLKLRDTGGELAETQNMQLAGNAQTPRFLEDIFSTDKVSAGRLDIEADDLIFGTAVTFIGGLISTLPMRPTPVEYEFENEDGQGVVTKGKLTLWAEGHLIRGFLESREQDGVPFDNPEVIPVAGALTNGVLQIAFPVGPPPDGGIAGFSFSDFSFDKEEVEGESLIAAFAESEVDNGTFRLTRVASP